MERRKFEDESSIVPKIVLSFPNVKPNDNSKQWDYLDDFMKEQFDDMDRELGQDELWINEVKDAVGINRGVGTWSTRSEKELRDPKKGVQLNTMKVPAKFVKLVIDVYLEKVRTMKDFRRENELTTIEFRKWMIDQRKRLKKNPLFPVKVAVSSGWLLADPSSGSIPSSPRVIMDEVLEPEISYIFEFKEHANEAIRAQMQQPQQRGQSTSTVKLGELENPQGSTGRLTTASMLQWEAGEEDLPQHVSSSLSRSRLETRRDSSDSQSNFHIDGVSILVAADVDYFVVI